VFHFLQFSYILTFLKIMNEYRVAHFSVSHGVVCIAVAKAAGLWTCVDEVCGHVLLRLVDMCC